jgi:DNA-binding transcriptional LysR family regulator
VPDPRQLAAFAAVAEERRFARAADRLGVSPPAISQLVQRLESGTGLQLFDRDSHSVSLTAAGERLLPAARRALAALEAFDQRASDLRTGAAGRLRIGTTDATGPLLERMLGAFAARHPGVDVHLTAAHTPAKLEAVVDGTLDVAFVREPPAVPGVRLRPVWSEPLVAVIAASHPLASAPAVDLVDLFDEPAIVTERQLNPGVFDAFVARCARAGFTPRLGAPYTTRQDALALVAGGHGWTLLPASADLGGAGVVARALTGPQTTVAVTLAWRAAGAAPIAESFVRLVADELAT